MAEAIFRHHRPSCIVQSAGQRISHVRPLVKRVLVEDDMDDYGLMSKDIFGVDLAEVTFVIGVGMPDPSWRLPSRFTIDWWVVPDPSCFAIDDQLAFPWHRCPLAPQELSLLP